jgi:hypothetical protein
MMRTPNWLFESGIATSQWEVLIFHSKTYSFVTADEYAVLESGEASSSTWHMGFLINPDTRRTLKEYPDITCPVTITLNGDAVPYYRNFPFQECSILTPFGIYVTSTEFEYIQHITDQRRVSALEDQAVVHKHELALARIDAEKNGDITNSNLFDDDDDDASEIVKEKKLPVKQCQHIQSPFSLASFTKWWKWFEEHHRTQFVTVEGCCTGTVPRQIEIQLSKLIAKHGDWRLWTANDFHDRVNAHFVPVADKSHLQTVTRALSVAKLDIGPHFDSQEPFTAFSAEVLQILELHREDHLSPEELKTVAYQIYNLIAVESKQLIQSTMKYDTYSFVNKQKSDNAYSY